MEDNASAHRIARKMAIVQLKKKMDTALDLQLTVPHYKLRPLHGALGYAVYADVYDRLLSVFRPPEDGEVLDCLNIIAVFFSFDTRVV